MFVHLCREGSKVGLSPKKSLKSRLIKKQQIVCQSEKKKSIKGLIHKNEILRRNSSTHFFLLLFFFFKSEKKFFLGFYNMRWHHLHTSCDLDTRLILSWHIRYDACLRGDRGTTSFKGLYVRSRARDGWRLWTIQHKMRHNLTG